MSLSRITAITLLEMSCACMCVVKVQVDLDVTTVSSIRTTLSENILWWEKKLFDVHFKSF